MTRSERPNVGFFDARDLLAYPWQERRTDWLATTAGLPMTNGESFRAIAAPPCTIVVADALLTKDLAPFVVWLASARHVIVVREWDATGDPGEDAELLSLVEEDWRTLTARLPNVILFDRRGDDPEPLRAALAHARGRALEVSAWAEPPIDVETALASLAATPWTRLELPPYGEIRAGQITHDGRHALLFDSARSTNEPLDGSASRLMLGGTNAIAARWDGASWAASPERTVVEVHSNGSVTRSAAIGVPIAFARSLPLAFLGHRMLFYWTYADGDELGTICGAEHDYPGGHAKKLYGYDCNDPRYVQLAARRDAYLSAFDHDVVIASSVAAGFVVRGDVACLERAAPDPLRAVFFESSAGQRDAFKADLTDEDARADPPPVVLGPSSQVRYAVGLGEETYRLRGNDAERLAGEPGTYLVCDSAHRTVRTGKGRLLAGTEGVATLEDEGELYRERLDTGERRHLGPAERKIATALPIQGAENVVLLSGGRDEERWLRVV